MMLTCKWVTVMSHGCTSTTRSVAAAIPELRFADSRGWHFQKMRRSSKPSSKLLVTLLAALAWIRYLEADVRCGRGLMSALAGNEPFHWGLTPKRGNIVTFPQHQGAA